MRQALNAIETIYKRKSNRCYVTNRVLISIIRHALLFTR